MKIVLQRVKEASVTVDAQKVGAISRGLLIFLGIGKNDGQSDVENYVEKIVQLRIFEDESGKMNLNALDVKAALLVVSQFTLYGDCKKGRRPSFDKAADPQTAEKLYAYFVDRLRKYPLEVATGQFRAMMDVTLVNDGPVTFILENDKA